MYINIYMIFNVFFIDCHILFLIFAILLLLYYTNIHLNLRTIIINQVLT